MVETLISPVERDLRELGIEAGGVLMVHASLRSLGPVEGGAEGLVETLLSLLGDRGTLMAYVDFEPTDDIPYFDPQQSPACFEYGALAEVIRRWPGALRSLNPGGSMAAIGARARWLCDEHPINYGYGPGSPLAKLVESKGQVLLLGSGLDNVTLLHYAEHCAKLRDKQVIWRVDKVLADGAISDLMIEEYDTSEPVVSDMPEDYFRQITQQFIDIGGARTGVVGQAPSALLPAREFVSFAIEKMESEFGG